MSIFSILRHNLGHGSRTRKPDDLPPRAAPFRGLIEQDPTLCTGCRNCSYVCSPKAIQFDDTGELALEWAYAADQCCFCGLCVMYCPTQALSNNGVLPQVGHDQSALHFTNEVPYHSCISCGTQMIPIPAQAAAKFFGEVTENTEELRLMCHECRRRTASEKIRDAFITGEKS